MDGIAQFCLDRIAYYETREKEWSHIMIEDLNLLIDMLKKANGEKLKTGKKPK